MKCSICYAIFETTNSKNGKFCSSCASKLWLATLKIWLTKKYSNDIFYCTKKRNLEKCTSYSCLYCFYYKCQSNDFSYSIEESINKVAFKFKDMSFDTFKTQYDIYNVEIVKNNDKIKFLTCNLMTERMNNCLDTLMNEIKTGISNISNLMPELVKKERAFFLFLAVFCSFRYGDIKDSSNVGLMTI